MAGLKEIKGRLQSVRNTKKITYAMKLVSAAKLRKAQDAVTRSREYTTALNGALSDLLAELKGADISHPLMNRRDTVKTVRIIVIGGSRGLCGGYNANVNKKLEAVIKEKSAQFPGAKIETVLVGRKPAEYARRVKREYVKSYEDLADDANLWPIEEICTEVETAFLEGKVDHVVLLYTRFKSAISMTVMAEQLLPMDEATTKGSAELTSPSTGVTLFEPSVAEVWNAIVPRIMRSRVRQASLDAKASEQGSRMTAMDSATKNSGDIIQSLQLTYNKLRQGRITAELLDIIGGAEALT